MAELSEKFESEEFLERVATENPSMLTKIRDFLKDIINWLKNVFSTEEIKRWQKAERMWEDAVKNAEVAERTGDVEYSFVKDNTENKVIDLSQDNNLTKLIGNEKGANKYKIIRDYILDVLSEQPITLSDGKTAIVDRSDALHIANRSANKKTAYISEIRKVIENAKIYAIEENVIHNKFNEFRYYQAFVKYGNEQYPIYLNVGNANNKSGYHIYDITKKIGDTAKPIKALERVSNDLRSEISTPKSNNNVPQKPNVVNTYNTQKSENDAKYLSAVEKRTKKSRLRKRAIL